MPESKTLMERRADSQAQIRCLVGARTQTLSLYSQLAMQRPFAGIRAAQRLLQQFCMSLVDYTATGHFRIYRFLDEKTERRRTVLEVAEQVYPRILKSTESILAFNDKYDCEDHCDNLSELEKDLSELGEIMAERIELEDRLIHVLTRPR